jgi:catalase
VAVLIAQSLGTVRGADGGSVEAMATLENSPAVLFDALVIPDGAKGIAMLGGDGRAKEFVVNIFRHGKAILALGAGTELLKSAGVPLASGSTGIPGVVIAASEAKDGLKAFLIATAKHRHPERELNPPLV